MLIPPLRCSITETELNFTPLTSCCDFYGTIFMVEVPATKMQNKLCRCCSVDDNLHFRIAKQPSQEGRFVSGSFYSQNNCHCRECVFCFRLKCEREHSMALQTEEPKPFICPTNENRFQRTVVSS